MHPRLNIGPRLPSTDPLPRASSKFTGVLTTFNSRTEFKEYQFRPLLKFLRSPSRRILIADEVGLGKTIEAAYIIVEQLASGHTERVLILCPAGLRQKWRDELWHRFGLYFEITNARGLGRLLSAKRGFLAIVSYDSHWDRRDSESVGMDSIDLIVIDEAHNLIGRGGDTQGGRSHSTCLALSNSAITLSATPIHLQIDDLRRVLEVTLGKKIERASFEEEATISSLINKTIREFAIRSCHPRIRDWESRVDSAEPRGPRDPHSSAGAWAY